MKFKIKWSKESKKQRQVSLLSLLITHHTNSSENFMELVEAGHEGIFASTDSKYSYAIFGRDSIEVAEDLLSSHRTLAKDVIITMASLQGVGFNPQSEEEPGKIHHEYRSLYFEGHPISVQSAAILSNLQHVWGSDGRNDMVYYGSCDATPLFIRLVGRYTNQYGDDILKEEYTGRDNKRHTIDHSIKAAEQWLVYKINLSPLGLLEYKRLNPRGIANQVWKDSETSYVHLDGDLANHDSGIASIELQGYAYDALKVAAKFSKSVSEREKLLNMAARIQKTVLEKFWLPDEDFFAEGLDYDDKGNSRQIKTLCSNGGALLESDLLRDLPNQVAAEYVQGIASLLFGSQFLTSAGIRSRALKYKDLPGFIDYHGSYTVWPKETYDIAKGLRNFGFKALAEQLENRILASVRVAGEFYEFFYVDEEDRLYYERDKVQQFLKMKGSQGSPLPQKGQAWVISAVLGIEDQSTKSQVADLAVGFEASLLAKITLVEPVPSS